MIQTDRANYEVRNKEVYTIIKCDSCLKDLKPIFEQDIHIWNKETKQEFYTSLQIDGALILNAEGYYGGYVDSIYSSEDDFRILLCKECADDLLIKVPYFKKILNSSHIMCT